jgi:sugar/nucleoside kinase (ribokinase family)
LLAELERAGVDVSGVAHGPSPTTRSLILLDPDGERTVINVARCEEDAPPARLLDIAADAVYVRSRRADLAPLLARKAADCLVIAHVPPVVPGSRPAHVIVCSASDLTPGDVRAPLAMGAAVAGEPLRWVVMTAGPAGARAFSAAQELAVAADRVATVDTTGAGDAFAAGLVHALVAGRPMPDALALAVRFGTEATRWAGSALSAPAVQRLLG